LNRVALDLGIIQIYWYSILIFLGIAGGCLVVYKETKKYKLNEDYMVNMLFYGIIFGLLGARIYYVAFNLDYYLKYPIEIFEIWNGGLAIHGGIIAGLLWIIFYTKKYKVPTFKILDFITPGLILGQAIGRWGNFFNQEAHGAVTTIEKLHKAGIPEFIIEGMNINGLYYHPTFLYESIWNITGFIAIMIIKRYKYLKKGQITAIYMMWYSFGRFFIEGFRTDSLMLGTFRIAQLVSVIMFMAGLFIFIFCKRGKHLDNLYREQDIPEIRY